MNTEALSPTAILFLDIDGVLNPWRSMNKLRGDWRKHQVFDDVGGSVRVWASENIGRYLNDLRANGVTIVWATSWIHFPAPLRRYAALFDLPPDLDQISYERITPTPQVCGKLPGVAGWLDDRSVDTSVVPVGWLDDDLGTIDKEFALERGILAIKTNPAGGLNDTNIRERLVAHLLPDRAAPLG